MICYVFHNVAFGATFMSPSDLWKNTFVLQSSPTIKYFFDSTSSKAINDIDFLKHSVVIGGDHSIFSKSQ